MKQTAILKLDSCSSGEEDFKIRSKPAEETPDINDIIELLAKEKLPREEVLKRVLVIAKFDLKAGLLAIKRLKVTKEEAKQIFMDTEFLIRYRAILPVIYGRICEKHGGYQQVKADDPFLVRIKEFMNFESPEIKRVEITDETREKLKPYLFNGEEKSLKFFNIERDKEISDFEKLARGIYKEKIAEKFSKVEKHDKLPIIKINPEIDWEREELKEIDQIAENDSFDFLFKKAIKQNRKILKEKIKEDLKTEIEHILGRRGPYVQAGELTGEKAEMVFNEKDNRYESRELRNVLYGDDLDELIGDYFETLSRVSFLKGVKMDKDGSDLEKIKFELAYFFVGGYRRIGMGSPRSLKKIVEEMEKRFKINNEFQEKKKEDLIGKILIKRKNEKEKKITNSLLDQNPNNVFKLRINNRGYFLKEYIDRNIDNISLEKMKIFASVWAKVGVEFWQNIWERYLRNHASELKFSDLEEIIKIAPKKEHQELYEIYLRENYDYCAKEGIDKELWSRIDRKNKTNIIYHIVYGKIKKGQVSVDMRTLIEGMEERDDKYDIFKKYYLKKIELGDDRIDFDFFSGNNLIPSLAQAVMDFRIKDGVELGVEQFKKLIEEKAGNLIGKLEKDDRDIFYQNLWYKYFKYYYINKGKEESDLKEITEECDKYGGIYGFPIVEDILVEGMAYCPSLKLIKIKLKEWKGFSQPYRALPELASRLYNRLRVGVYERFSRTDFSDLSLFGEIMRFLIGEKILERSDDCFRVFRDAVDLYIQSAISRPDFDWEKIKEKLAENGDEELILMMELAYLRIALGLEECQERLERLNIIQSEDPEKAKKYLERYLKDHQNEEFLKMGGSSTGILREMFVADPNLYLDNNSAVGYQYKWGSKIEKMMLDSVYPEEKGGKKESSPPRDLNNSLSYQEKIDLGDETDPLDKKKKKVGRLSKVPADDFLIKKVSTKFDDNGEILDGTVPLGADFSDRAGKEKIEMTMAKDLPRGEISLLNIPNGKIGKINTGGILGIKARIIGAEKDEQGNYKIDNKYKDNIRYTMEVFKKFVPPFEVTEENLHEVLNSLSTEQRAELDYTCGEPPEEIKNEIERIKNISSLTERLEAVKELLGEIFYYDVDNKEIGNSKKGASFEDRILMCRMRMMELLNKMEEKGENTEKLQGKLYAGICQDIGYLGANLLRWAGIPSAIGSGVIIKGKNIYVGAQYDHLRAYALWPDAKDIEGKRSFRLVPVEPKDMSKRMDINMGKSLEEVIREFKEKMKKELEQQKKNKMEKELKLQEEEKDKKEESEEQKIAREVKDKVAEKMKEFDFRSIIEEKESEISKKTEASDREYAENIERIIKAIELYRYGGVKKEEDLKEELESKEKIREKYLGENASKEESAKMFWQYLSERVEGGAMQKISNYSEEKNVEEAVEESLKEVKEMLAVLIRNMTPAQNEIMERIKGF